MHKAFHMFYSLHKEVRSCLEIRSSISTSSQFKVEIEELWVIHNFIGIFILFLRGTERIVEEIILLFFCEFWESGQAWLFKVFDESISRFVVWSDGFNEGIHISFWHCIHNFLQEADLFAFWEVCNKSELR